MSNMPRNMSLLYYNDRTTTTMRRLIFAISLCAVLFSFLPYSFSTVFGHIESLLFRREETLRQHRQIISPDVANVSAKAPILFITPEGNSGKTFFELSYVLFPGTVYWINPSPKGPISWWNEAPLTTQSISQVIRLYSIQTIITEGAMDEILQPIATYSSREGNVYQYSTL